MSKTPKPNPKRHGRTQRRRRRHNIKESKHHSLELGRGYQLRTRKPTPGPPPPPPAAPVAVTTITGREATPPQKSPTKEITKQLNNLGLEHLTPIFLNDEFDIKALPLLTRGDLTKLGVTNYKEQTTILDWGSENIEPKALPSIPVPPSPPKPVFLNEEEAPKIAVFGVGKFQAPHKGHRKLVNKIIELSTEVGGDAFLFTTQRDNKLNNSTKLKTLKNKELKQKDKNEGGPGHGFINLPPLNDAPLNIEVKLKLLNKLFNNGNIEIMDVQSPYGIAQILLKKKYNEIILVAGSDRLTEDGPDSYRTAFIPKLKEQFRKVRWEMAGEERNDETALEAPSGKNVRKWAVEMKNKYISKEKQDEAFQNLKNLLNGEEIPTPLTDDEIKWYAQQMRSNMNRGGSRKKTRKNISK